MIGLALACSGTMRRWASSRRYSGRDCLLLDHDLDRHRARDRGASGWPYLPRSPASSRLAASRCSPPTSRRAAPWSRIVHVAIGLASPRCSGCPSPRESRLRPALPERNCALPSKLLEDLLASPSPVTAVRRVRVPSATSASSPRCGRAARRRCSSRPTAFVLLLACATRPNLALDLAPGQGVARLGTERLAQLARPCLGRRAPMASRSSFATCSRRVARREAAPERLVGPRRCSAIVCASTLRVCPAFWRTAEERSYGEARVLAGDPFGRMELEHWAAGAAAQVKPGAWARAMFEEDNPRALPSHTGETGLPSFHLGPQSRPLACASASRTPARRACAGSTCAGRSASIVRLSFGDPATENIFGSYHVRELSQLGRQVRAHRSAQPAA